jgi:hypothetical protein
MRYDGIRDPDYFDVCILPDEVLINIFQYCGLKCVTQISRVCKKWNNISDCDQVWGEILKASPKQIKTNSKKMTKNYILKEQQFLVRKNITRTTPAKCKPLCSIIRADDSLCEDVIFEMWGLTRN